MRENRRFGAEIQLDEVLGLLFEIRLAAMDIEVRVRLNPRMIDGGVVGYEIQQHTEPAPAKTIAQYPKGVRASEISVNFIFRDGKRRACNVVFGEIGKRLVKAGLPLGSLPRDLRAGWTGLPNAKQPNPVETKTGDAIEVKIRYLVELTEAVEFLRTAIEPIADIDLKDGRIGSQWRNLRLSCG